MSPAYISAILKNLPDAKIVFDHFHVIKLFNDKLSELRRQLYHEVNDILQKQAIKGTRWLLLKNPENLDPNRDEHRRLNEALELNQPLEKISVIEHFVFKDFYVDQQILNYIKKLRKSFTTVLLTNFPAHIHDFMKTFTRDCAFSQTIGSHVSSIDPTRAKRDFAV